MKASTKSGLTPIPGPVKGPIFLGDIAIGSVASGIAKPLPLPPLPTPLPQALKFKVVS